MEGRPVTQDVDPAGAVLGLLFGGALLVLLAAPLNDYSTINLELWGTLAIAAGIGFGGLVVVVALSSRM
jgi:hypothetical protein